MTWQTERIMTPLQYRRIIKLLSLTQAGAARFLGVSERTSRRYIEGTAVIPVSVALLLRSMIAHDETPIVPKWER